MTEVEAEFLLRLEGHALAAASGRLSIAPALILNWIEAFREINALQVIKNDEDEAKAAAYKAKAEAFGWMS